MGRKCPSPQPTTISSLGEHHKLLQRGPRLSISWNCILQDLNAKEAIWWHVFHSISVTVLQWLYSRVSDYQWRAIWLSIKSAMAKAIGGHYAPISCMVMLLWAAPAPVTFSWEKLGLSSIDSKEFHNISGRPKRFYTAPEILTANSQIKNTLSIKTKYQFYTN